MWRFGRQGLTSACSCQRKYFFAFGRNAFSKHRKDIVQPDFGPCDFDKYGKILIWTIPKKLDEARLVLIRKEMADLKKLYTPQEIDELINGYRNKQLLKGGFMCFFNPEFYCRKNNYKSKLRYSFQVNHHGATSHQHVVDIYSTDTKKHLYKVFTMHVFNHLLPLDINTFVLDEHNSGCPTSVSCDDDFIRSFQNSELTFLASFTYECAPTIYSIIQHFPWGVFQFALEIMLEALSASICSGHVSRSIQSVELLYAYDHATEQVHSMSIEVWHRKNELYVVKVIKDNGQQWLLGSFVMYDYLF